MDTEGYRTVVNDRSKRKRMSSQEQIPNAAAIHPSGPTNNRITTKSKTVIGSNTNCPFKAAKGLKKKKVFCVSNLSVDTTCDNLQSWIQSYNIPVLSIFEAKTKYADSVAFRVCVADCDADKFASNDMWSASVLVREWVFKTRAAS